MRLVQLDESAAHRCGVALAGIRTAFGVAAMLAPERAADPWVGHSNGPQNRALGRALAGRDLALGLGGLVSAGDRAQLRRWVIAGGIADAGDLTATLTTPRLPRRGAAGVTILTAGAVVAAWCVAKGLGSAR